MSEEVYAQSHLSRFRGWFDAPAGMATSPTASPQGDDPTCGIQRSVVIRSKQVYAEDRPLQSLWNASVPVNRLPPEIMLEIFQALRAVSEYDGELTETSGRWVSWTRLSYVCRSWRDVICNSALFWQNIHVKNELRWVELCLSRSREIPLNIFFHSSATLPGACDILSSHTRRIKRVTVRQTARDTVSCLTRFFQPIMPMLQRFSLDACHTESDTTCFGDSNFFHLLPSLNTLRLGYAHIDWNSVGARKLRVLHLRDWTPPDKHLLSLRQFLNALQEFQALEDLLLDFAFPFETYTADGVRDVSGPIVSLPNIRKLYFLCPVDEEPTSPDVYHLLAHLQVPVSAQLYIYSQTHDYTTGPGEGGYLETIPRDPECLPILQSATTAHLFRLGFDCRCGSGQIGINLEPLRLEALPWEYAPEQAIDQFCTLFAKAPLRELVVELVSTEEAWTRLFRTFPSVAVFKVKILGMGRHPDDEVEDGLFAALVSAAPNEDVTSDSDDTLVLPNLRAFEYRAIWHEDTLSNLVQCLRARAARGAKLRELTLGLSQRVRGDPEADVMHEAFLYELDGLVEEHLAYTDLSEIDMLYSRDA